MESEFIHELCNSEWKVNLPINKLAMKFFNLIPRPPRFYVAAMEKNLCDKIWEED